MKTNLKLFVILLLTSIVFSQTEVPDDLLDSLIHQSRQAGQLADALKLSQAQHMAAIVTIESADSTIHYWKKAFQKEHEINLNNETIHAANEKIISIYQNRADMGNRLVVTAAVGLGFYLAGGKYREPDYMFGSMGATYGVQYLTGWTVNLFRLNPWSD